MMINNQTKSARRSVRRNTHSQRLSRRWSHQKQTQRHANDHDQHEHEHHHIVRHTSKFADSIFGDPIQGGDARAPCVIHPNSRFINAWNLLNALFIIICALFLPFQMAFNYTYGFDGTFDQIFWAIIWPIMDTYFFIDIVVNFRTAFVSHGELEQDTNRMINHYAHGWFVIDLVSTLSSPLELAASGLGIGRNMRVLKLLKLTKLMRLAKLQSVMDRLGDLAQDVKLLFGFIKLFLAVSGFAHVIGCGWWAISTLEEERSWPIKYYGEAEAAELSISEKYVGSVFWSFITITTVGYGDITPATDAERIYALITTFVGTGLFAYITGEVTALATTRHASSQALEHKLEAVKEFMHYYKLPKHLCRNVRDYYRGSFYKSFFSFEEILEDLPQELAMEVNSAVMISKFMENPWFRVMSIEKSYPVEFVNEEDSKFLQQHAKTPQQEGTQTTMAELKYKDIYVVAVATEPETEDVYEDSQKTYKVSASELFYSNDPEAKAADSFKLQWTRTLQHLSPKSAMFDYRTAVYELFCDIVASVTVREVEADRVAWNKGQTVKEIAILESGELQVGMNNEEYIFIGSFLGFCDKAHTIAHHNSLLYSDTFIARTNCKFSILSIKELREILPKHGHAVIRGLGGSKFFRMARMAQTFKTAALVGPGALTNHRKHSAAPVFEHSTKGLSRSIVPVSDALDENQSDASMRTSSSTAKLETKLEPISLLQDYMHSAASQPQTAAASSDSAVKSNSNDSSETFGDVASMKQQIQSLTGQVANLESKLDEVSNSNSRLLLSVISQNKALSDKHQKSLSIVLNAIAGLEAGTAKTTTPSELLS